MDPGPVPPQLLIANIDIGIIHLLQGLTGGTDAGFQRFCLLDTVAMLSTCLKTLHHLPTA